ncbi:diacylglycerol/lipid kinase family protein [Salipiger mucosus]|uniref:Transcription regulator n=1 Tax=Salipiger mucosus DSM 16094 TaxID=1123237 RepID=S9QZJ2_9RHOB|nr:diacylglycerol kinase family protein [Salipiger mucosus]EPX86811.1 Transcription regulator [Salipiger mucosus DSM 16094]
MSSDQNVCVILNEKSGDHPEGTSRRARLETLLSENGLQAHILTPQPGRALGETARRALDRGCKMLVAAGGDGTICAVAEACHAADAPMGVIPQGTFNYFARGLGIPEDMAGAVRVLATGQKRGVRLGEVNGEVFLNNASLGLYPLILNKREGVYNRWGRSRIAAYWSVVLTLSGFRRPMKLRINRDGEETRLRTPLAFVANSAFQLEQFNLDGADEVRAGRFAMLTSRADTRGALARHALRLANGWAARGEDFDLMTGEDILVDTGRKRALVARDGEKSLMRAPVRFRLRERPLQVVVPGDDTEDG